jgi:hypothetical protein
VAFFRIPVAVTFRNSGSSLQKFGSSIFINLVALPCSGWLSPPRENLSIWVLLGMTLSSFHVAQMDPMTIKQGIELWSKSWSTYPVFPQTRSDFVEQTPKLDAHISHDDSAGKLTPLLCHRANKTQLFLS